MSNRKKQNKALRSFWTGSIFVSLVLVLVSLIFVSCAKPPAEAENTPPLQEETGRNQELPSPEAPEIGGITPTGEPQQGSDPMPPVTEPQQGNEPTSGGAEPGSTNPGGENPGAQTPEQPLTQLAETGDMGREYLEQIIFLGDSTTYGLGYYYDHGYTELVPPTQVWTPSSGTLTLDQWSYVAIKNPETGEEQMLADLLALKLPKYLCITLGVNGVSFMKEDYFKQSYTSLVQKVQEVSPDTTIILNSIYPVTTGYEAKNNGINNLKIEAANLWISAIAQSCGVHYLDSASVLRNENRVLPDTYTNGDGLHLNGEAFGLVVNYIRTHGC